MIVMFAFAPNAGAIKQAKAQVAPLCNANNQSQTYVSSDTNNLLQVNGHNAVAVNPIHPAWDAVIPGAMWVWSENPLTDGAASSTQSFVQTFTIAGTPANGNVMVAADNTYTITVNGTPVGSETVVGDNFNTAGQDAYVIPASALLTGSNTITFTVTNFAGETPNTTGLENPAGLMYKLNVGCVPSVDGGGECADMTYFSDSADTNLMVDGHTAVAVAPINAGWTASIPGAQWVWSDATIADTTVALTKTFTKTFNISGTPGDAHLWIAADNGYKVSVNGYANLFADPEEFNYTAAGQDEYTIPAADLVSGSNTITFEVTNMGVASTDALSNPAGLLYRLDSGCTTGDNGGNDNCPVIYARIKFSNGAVGSRNWNTGSSTDANMDKVSYVGGNAPANAYGDGVWFPITNPDGSFINDADIAPYRNVPGLAVQRSNGALRVVLYGTHDQAGGEVKELAAGSIELTTDNPSGTSTPSRLLGAWDKPNSFVDPADAYTRIHDASVNDPANPMDSRGAFNGNINQYNERFDNVRVFNDLFQFHLVATTGNDGFYARYDAGLNENCGGEITTFCVPQPGMPVYARIKFATDPNSNFGARNKGTGNLTKDVYVGGNAPANVYGDGQWFMLYDGMNYMTDPDIASYEDVPGLAVQRLNGQVRIVLHGSLSEPVGNPVANTERVQATLEFSNNQSTRSTDAVPVSQVSDPANALDFAPGKNTNDPQDDRVQIVNNLSQFKMVVNTNDDGFYTNYTNTQGVPCGETNPQ